MNRNIRALVLKATESGSCCFTVISNSMYPTLMKGDLITVEKSQKYRVGNIIAFVQENNIVVHRLIWKKFSGWYYTKGDAAENRIERFKVESIVGRVIKRKRKGKEKIFGSFSGKIVSIRSLMEYLVCRFLKQ